MSETFSFHPSYLTNPGSSSSLSQSKTPPPLESAFSSSDQFSPTTADSAGSSPKYVNPMSLTIPNPFLAGSGPSHDTRDASGAGVTRSPHLEWRADIQPAPVSSVGPPSNVHRPIPGRTANTTTSATAATKPPTGNEPFSQSSSNVTRPNSTNRSPRQKNKSVKMEEKAAAAAAPPPGKDRRQKRLERNRESARLSRRRRKQYLEILETKVTELSDEMDKGRRHHVSQALNQVKLERQKGFFGPNVARASTELRLAALFRSQQMQSLCTPPSTKFILWLTLQNDVYYRGGRAASERLSAARIGERMLQNGNDKVTPAQSMWPLFCNEVGLSYDQEERLRHFQKSFLAAKESWLERHTAYASSLTIKSTHEAVQAVSFRLGHRERSLDGLLTSEQRSKLSNFVSAQRATLKERLESQPKTFDGYYQTNPNQHVAANLYVTNHRLKSVLNTIPAAAPLLTGLALKKLSRRPYFESLGVVGGEKDGNDHHELSRDRSFASSGSLKRSASEMSMEGEDRAHVQTVTPEEAEAAALPHVESVLGHLKPIIPVPTPAAPAMIQTATHSVPRPVNSAPVLSHNPSAYAESVLPTPVLSAPAPTPSDNFAMAPPPAMQPIEEQEPAQKHQRKSSFLPPHLNVVPEEMWPAADSVAEEFLMSLVDEDWAIGEGVDMET